MCVLRVVSRSGDSTCPVPQALSRGVSGYGARHGCALTTRGRAQAWPAEAEQSEGGSTGLWERGRPQRRGAGGGEGLSGQGEKLRDREGEGAKSTSTGGRWALG